MQVYTSRPNKEHLSEILLKLPNELENSQLKVNCIEISKFLHSRT